MKFPNPHLWDDFCLFARALVLSGDADPVHPLLRRAYELDRLSRETALWRTLLYVTWFHPGAAEKVWTLHKRPTVEIDPVRFASLPAGIERRGFRGVVGNVQARAFVSAVLTRAGGDLSGWVASFGTGEVGWRSARRELEAVPGAGPWASLKWVELLRAVHGLDLQAPDVGSTSKGAAPVVALACLTGLSREEAAAPDAHQVLFNAAITAGVPLRGLDQLGAVLTAFSGLLRGAYYPGQAIDLQMTQLDGAGPSLWAARAVFPRAYRGELGKPAWSGVRKELKRRYAQHGELVNLWV